MNEAPIYLAPIDRDFVPHRYKIFIHSQHCDSCGSSHKWSEVYGETRLRATMGHGYVDNRRPASHMKQIQYNLPLVVVPQNSNIPFCHLCLRPQMLSHLPNAPIPASDPRTSLINMQIVQKAPTHTRWQDKHGNWHLDAAEQPKLSAKTPKAKKFTVDDL